MKKILALVAALFMMAVLVPPAHAAQKYSVSMYASASSVNVGSTVRISGRVSPKAAGQTVTIQKKRAGDVWKNEAKVKIATNGTYSYLDRPSTAVNRQYRVYKAKSGKIAAAYSRTLTVKVTKPVQQATSVSVTAVSPRTLDAGQQLTVAGRTSANLKGKTITLQRLNGSTWVTLTSARVSTSATFSITAKVTQAGANQKVRAYVAATATTKAAVSTTQTYSVYGWYYLADLSKIDDYSFGYGAISIAGVPYLKSVSNTSGFAYGNISWAEWGLNYKCTQLRATIGLSDTSRSGSQVAYVTKVDALESGLGTMANGQSRPIAVDLTNGYRLRLESQWVAGTKGFSANMKGAWGDARIRCAL